MSAGPDLFAQQMAAKSSGQDKEGATGGNDGLKAGDPKKLVGVAGKLIIPGVNVGALLDHGGLFQGFDSEGPASKPIMPSGLLKTGETFLSKIVATLMKHREITDHTQGIGTPEALFGSLTPFTGGGAMVSAQGEGFSMGSNG